jgi:cell division septation protein DedD
VYTGSNVPAGCPLQKFATMSHAEVPVRTLDRRRHPRKRLTFTYTELGKENAGTIVDIGESGLCVQTILALPSDPEPQVRFQPSDSGDWIEVKGRIVWSAESEKLAGIEFVDLSEVALKKIRQLLSSAPYLSQFQTEVKRMELSVPELDTGIDLDLLQPKPSTPSSINQKKTSAPTTLRTPDISGDITTSAAKRSMTWLFVAVSAPFLLTLVVIWAYQAGSVNNRIGKIESSNEIVATPGKPAQPQQTDFRSLPDHPTPTKAMPSSGPPAQLQAVSPPSRRALESSRFGVQVAAMTQKQYVDELVSSLREKDVPFRVLSPTSDSFYRVVVGPYPDKRLADDAKSKLETWGFKPFIVPWKP